jgi:hypothetical protein
MPWDNSQDEALDALLSGPSRRPEAASRAEIELLLTDGYASVLELEAERRLLLQQGQPPVEIETIGERLVSLRDRLDEANGRYGGSRQDHLDGASRAGRRTDEQLPS